MDAVVFDMDGVILVDTEQHWHAAERELFDEIVDADVDPQQLIDRFTGMYFKDIYDGIAAEYPVTVSKEAFVDRFHTVAETVYRRATMMDGFPALVADLEERGVPVAVATSSPRRWIDTVNDRFALDDTVRFILSAEDIDGDGKPAPDIYEAAADRLGVAPADCAAVEDSLNGVKAAAAAGMHTIAFRPGQAEATEIADETVDGPDELRSALFARL